MIKHGVDFIYSYPVEKEGHKTRYSTQHQSHGIKLTVKYF
jgi:hypothetical protein